MADTVKEEVVEVEVQGSLYASLDRSNKQIRQERGDALAEQIETAFRRDLEDMRYKIRDMKRRRTNMYDFSPTNSQSLVMAKDIEAPSILRDDKALSIEIRNKQIEIEVMEERYLELFGKRLSE